MTSSRRAAQMRKSAVLVMPPGSTSAPAMVACRVDSGCWGTSSGNLWVVQSVPLPTPEQGPLWRQNLLWCLSIGHAQPQAPTWDSENGMHFSWNVDGIGRVDAWRIQDWNMPSKPFVCMKWFWNHSAHANSHRNARCREIQLPLYKQNSKSICIPSCFLLPAFICSSLESQRLSRQHLHRHSFLYLY